MKFLFSWSSSRPFAALALAGGLSLLLGLGALRLRVDGSMEHLLSEHDPRVTHLREVMENFGERPVVLAMAEAPNLFSPDTVELLRRYASDLAAVEGIESTASLFDTPLPGGRAGPMHAEPPLSPESVAREGLTSLRATLLDRSLVRNHLLSEDGEALAVLLFLEPESKTNHERLVDRLEYLRAEHETRLPAGSRLTLLGAPLVKARAQEHIRWDLAALGPAALLIVGAVIYLFYRSLAAVLLPLVTGVLSTVATLGFMGFAGYEISVFLSSIIVLVLVLGCTEDLHILSDYWENLAEGMEKLLAISAVGGSAGRALLMASGTTVLSFVTLAFTPITGLRDFSISCAVGMTLNFLVTVLVAPALLALLPVPPPREGRWLKGIETTLVSIFLKRRAASVGTLAFALLVVGAGIAKLETDTDYLRFFSERSPVVESYRRFADRFGGASIVTVTYETGRRNGVYDPEALDGLYRLNAFLAVDGGTTMGLCEFIDDFQKALSRPLPGPGAVPESRDITLFREASIAMPLRSFLDYDRSRAAIRLRADAATSKSLVALERRILAFAQQELSGKAEVRVTGDRVIVAHLCEKVTSLLTTDLVAMGGIIAILVGWAARCWRQGLLVLIPNLYPIATTFGAMGWLGIPLGMGTFPVAIVAFGIAVDDTIHFIFRFNTELKAGRTPTDAVRRTISRELRPILAASITVAAGYLVMTASPFRINREIGLLFSATMIGALVADLILTPVLLKSGLSPKPIHQ